MNDYACHTFKRSKAVKLNWIGHPGDSPVDVRARELMVTFDRGGGITQGQFDKAIANRRPVVRWVYHCAGVHDRYVDNDEETATRTPSGNNMSDGEPGLGEDSDSGSEDEAEGQGEADVEDVDEDADRDEDQEGRRKRWHKCSDGVKLRVRPSQGLVPGHRRSRVPIYSPR